MPVTKCSNKKWRIGSGPCMYKTKAAAEKAYAAYRAQENNLEGQYQSFTANLNGLVRHDKMEGREYVVAPMVMLVEGVHNGSNGPLYYPSDELDKTPCIWNMKPVVVYHPQLNGRGVSACDPDIATNHKVGVIMNTRFEEGKLKAEAWLEVERCNAVDERILAALDNGEMMELSTGLFTDNEYLEGEWNGESYEAVVRNFRPDHLALLPDLKGACSIKDGAGFLRLNQDGKDKGMDKILSSIISRLQVFEADQETDKEEVIANRYVEKVVEVIKNQMSYDNIRGQLARQMDEINGTDEFVWILDVYDGFFVYEFQGRLWMLNYSKDNDIIEIEGEPVEVTQVTEYRKVADGTFVGNQDKNSLVKNERKHQMDRKEQIEKLIENGSWTEEDRQFLQDMEDVQFEKIMKMNEVQSSNTNDDGTNDDGINNDGTGEDGTKSEPTGNEDPLKSFIAQAPPEVAEVLTNSMDLLEEQKTQLIETILANENNTFTKDELSSKGIKELKGLAKLASKPETITNSVFTVPNYAGQGDPPSPAVNKEEPLGLPTMNFEPVNA